MKLERTVIERLYNKLISCSFYPFFGAELEFYLIGAEADDFLKCLNFNSNFKNFKKERGKNQLEYASPVFVCWEDLLQDLSSTKQIISSTAKSFGCEASFDPKPYEDDYGSALHFNLSLHEGLCIESTNLFGSQAADKNHMLLAVIFGILKILPVGFYLISGDNEKEFNRFKPNHMTPVNVSWGGNNRTVAIRIPDSSSKRIEFRVPSASAEHPNVLAFLLAGVLHGLKILWSGKFSNFIQQYPKTYGDAAIDYKLRPFPASVAEARNCFNYGFIEDILGEGNA